MLDLVSLHKVALHLYNYFIRRPLYGYQPE